MKAFHSIVLFLISICSIYAQSKVVESLSVKSELLNTEVKYSVYLPEDYNNFDNSYPVVYLLNGFTGNETDWIRIGLVKDIADELIRGKKIMPMILIMPDGDDRLYMNKDDGTYPYEDMFMKEFIPYIEKEYRIKSQKAFRAICGLSMGGSGSLRLAFKHHEIFGACAAFSAGISTEEEIKAEPSETFDAYFGRISPSIIGKKGKDRLTETMRDYDVLNLVKNKDVKLLKTVAIYFDCGDDDFLTLGNTQLHIDLTKKGIPHEFRMRDGGHTWSYWRDSLPIGLQFISNAMHNLNKQH